MNFFVVSAGKPGSDYIESNFRDILDSKEFAVHEETKQKGTYFSIEENDVLILKYQKRFVAYGVVVRTYKNKLKDFSLRVEVEEWVLHDSDDPTKGIPRYGIQKATIGGGKYGTVKTVRPNFGLDKIKLINVEHYSFDKIRVRYKESNVSLKKEGDFFELHEELFNFLLDKSYEDPEFTFVVRESNNARSLDRGYWFYGEKTVALSFWTGMDHFNDRPIISFLINPNTHCKLVIQTDIYKELRDYILSDDYWVSYLGLKEKDELFEKEYTKYQLSNYVDCLDHFLRNDYNKINNLFDNFRTIREGNYVEESYVNEDYVSDKKIVKFPVSEFNSRLNNLFRYRQKNSPELTLYSIEDEKKADRLQHMIINNYGLIKQLELDFGNSRWVFITGENGSGKTMLLRAIGSALGNRTLPSKELTGGWFSIDAKLTTDGRIIPFKRQGNENVKANREIVSRGLAMYGPYRLEQTSSQVKDETFRKALGKTGSFASLFAMGSKLLSFDKQLELWNSSSRSKRYLMETRMKQISILLPRIIPDLREVNYRRKNRNKYDVEYLIQTKGNHELMNLKWDELSSGNKNILNLVSDIIIRLFNQQPKITDPSELRGIVLIDEIDLHLHPKAQRDFVVTLSETFPLLQFIVTTHSPIPLLGAPEGSAFFVVNRDGKRGVYTTRLHDLEKNFKNLLPNALLTSDLFDLEEITHKDVRAEDVNTSNTYDKYQLDQELDKQLKILKSKDDETFNDFFK